MRESRWTQRLRETYGVNTAVSAANVPRASAGPLLASLAPTPPDRAAIVRQLSADLLDAARRLGDAGFLDDLWGSVRADDAVLNHEALLSSCVVLIHQPDDVKLKVRELVTTIVADLRAGSTERP